MKRPLSIVEPDNLARKVNFFELSPSRLKNVLAPKIKRLNNRDVTINAMANLGITFSMDSMTHPLHLIKSRSTCVVRMPATKTIAMRASSTPLDIEILYA